MKPQFYGAGRAVVVAAHPDDETVGAGGCLPRLRLPFFIHVTDGAPRDMADARANGFTTCEEYAQARRRELLDALHAGSIRPPEMIAMGYADQETSWHLAELAVELRRLFERLRPGLILTHPYEGGHPDHDSTAFAVSAAWRMLPLNRRPQLMEYTSYHNRGGEIETGVFMPDRRISEVMIPLDAEDRARKEEMMACFRTQQPTLQYFRALEERFRPAPDYDFLSPPHTGALFYDRFSWGINGARWQSLARSAMRDLGLC